jgi:hypothetical protein
MEKPKSVERVEVTPDEKINRALSIVEEVLAHADMKENLKFKFDFKKYFPEKDNIIFKERENKDNTIVFVDKRLYQLPTGTDPYYQMQVDLQLYYIDAVFRSNLFGQLKMQRDIFRWIKKNYSNVSKDAFNQLMKILSEHDAVTKDMSPAEKLALGIFEELQKKHGNLRYSPRSLHKLPEKLKKEARTIGYLLLKTHPSPKMLIDTVLRAPRKSRKGEDDTQYSLPKRGYKDPD